MDTETSLLWHGPTWFAGRCLPGSAGPIPGLTSDIDLITTWRTEAVLPDTLPSVVLLDTEALDRLDARADFTAWLAVAIEDLRTDVPILLLCKAGDDLSGFVRPTAIVDREIPDETLFATACDLQRSLMRSEEARIRRMSFGRVPGYGSAPHHKGTSGLLIVGMGGRLLQVQQASQRNVEIVGAFDQQMGEDYLAQRAFDAVILDDTFDENLENLRRIRMDARFAALPVLAVAEQASDIPTLFRAGASDVLRLPLQETNLSIRLSTAIRFGKRRRLADKVLAESHKWLREQLNTGGVPQAFYTRYSEKAGAALAKRSLEIWEMKLLPENFSTPDEATLLAPALYGTVLSIADATSREEDLVCFVHDVGPIAVLKSERGKARLQARINAILGHTRL
ncbi:hypothetical protein [Roseibium polysiphoniae]|uniref:hypothetical protein n=1 Tax=Roseibium polysiphoniae TaxID=2571221 RepID=UPI001FEB985E|nr:hypothetical protein [Roseibium polysiphoniae]